MRDVISFFGRFSGFTVREQGCEVPRRTDLRVSSDVNPWLGIALRRGSDGAKPWRNFSSHD